MNPAQLRLLINYGYTVDLTTVLPYVDYNQHFKKRNATTVQITDI